MKALLLALAITALVAGGRAAIARELAVPEGARTHFVIRDPHEIVAWVAFDTAPVRERLPDELRFVTIGELAAGGVRWATEQLAELERRADELRKKLETGIPVAQLLAKLKQKYGRK